MRKQRLPRGTRAGGIANQPTVADKPRALHLKDFFAKIKLGSLTGHPSEERYEVQGDVVSAGTYGLVVKACDRATTLDGKKSGPASLRAVKILKPEHARNKKAVEDFLGEVAILAQIQHPNIIRILDWGTAAATAVDGTTCPVPFYVMEWLEATDVQKVLDAPQARIDERFLRELARQSLSGIAACHRCDPHILHLDIKPDNLLLLNVVLKPELDLTTMPSYHFVITDFGKAKLLFPANAANPYDTPGGGIYEYVHPILRPYLRKNKVPRAIFDKHWWQFDIFSLGTVLSRVLDAVRQRSGNADSSDCTVWQYLAEDMCHLGVKEAPRLHKPIEDTTDLLVNVRRIAHTRDHAADVRPEQKSLIRLLGQQTIEFPARIAHLVDAPEFQRLRCVRQLGFTSLVYPSAVHSRFDHSIGAYHLAGEYVRRLQAHPLYLYLFDDVDSEAVRLAALLHDLGQYSFAHSFEEIGGLHELKVDHMTLTRKIMSGAVTFKQFCDSKLAEKWLRPRVMEANIAERLKDFPLAQVMAVLEGKGKYRLLKSMIDGPLDCDKLDYLIRDSLSAGVPYSHNIDLGRFFSALTVDDHDENRLALAVTSKGRPAVESIMSARYHMFSEVYWHKTVRAASAMAKEALWLARKEIKQEEFELAVLGYDPQRFLVWLGEKLPEQIASDLLLDSLGVFCRRSIYKRIKTYSDVFIEEEKKQAYHKFYNDLGKDYARISKYRDALVEQLNERGRHRHGWRELVPHQVIVDVPTSQRDQFESVPVSYPAHGAAREEKKFYAMSEISRLSQAIHDNFIFHTKKVRIFCHPGVRDQVYALGSDVDSAVAEAWEAVD